MALMLRLAISAYELAAAEVDALAADANDPTFNAAVDRAIDAMLAVTRMPVRSRADALRMLWFCDACGATRDISRFRAHRQSL
jgi:hypothetical protein